MQLKKKLLKDSNLYLILDHEVNDYKQLLNIAKKAINYGVDIIQLRDKKGSAREILKFSESLKKISFGKVLFIVNDRIDIAKICKADGVHLGQQDLPIEEARKMLGKNVIIGISCQTIKHVQDAQDKGADYVGFGSVFKTLTKPNRSPMNLNLLKNVFRNVKIPLFCIGGITLNNILSIKKLGCSRIAICRDICLADNIKEKILAYKKCL